VVISERKIIFAAVRLNTDLNKNQAQSYKFNLIIWAFENYQN
jgi:hypothetical protein